MRTLMMMALLLTLAGCATSHYGREPALGPTELAAKCPAIGVEIAQCDTFTQDIYYRWSARKARRFWGFLIDAGIGDRQERDAALESGAMRRAQLVAIGAKEHCPAPPAAPTE
jgi:hypothetical protein